MIILLLIASAIAITCGPNQRMSDVYRKCICDHNYYYSFKELICKPINSLVIPPDTNLSVIAGARNLMYYDEIKFTYRFHFKRTINKQPAVLFSHPTLLRVFIDIDARIIVEINSVNPVFNVTTAPNIVQMNVWTHVLILEDSVNHYIKIYVDNSLAAMQYLPTIQLKNKAGEIFVTIGYNIGKVALMEVFYYIHNYLPDFIHWRGLGEYTGNCQFCYDFTQTDVGTFFTDEGYKELDYESLGVTRDNTDYPLLCDFQYYYYSASTNSCQMKAEFAYITQDFGLHAPATLPTLGLRSMGIYVKPRREAAKDMLIIRIPGIAALSYSYADDKYRGEFNATTFESVLLGDKVSNNWNYVGIHYCYGKYEFHVTSYDYRMYYEVNSSVVLNSTDVYFLSDVAGVYPYFEGGAKNAFVITSTICTEMQWFRISPTDFSLSLIFYNTLEQDSDQRSMVYKTSNYYLSDLVPFTYQNNDTFFQCERQFMYYNVTNVCLTHGNCGVNSYELSCDVYVKGYYSGGCIGYETSTLCNIASKNCAEISGGYNKCTECDSVLAVLSNGHCDCVPHALTFYMFYLLVCNPVCGDGYLMTSEICDDANILEGDGCSSGCSCEPGYKCITPDLQRPSLCYCLASISVTSTWNNYYKNLIVTFSRAIVLTTSNPYDIINDTSLLGINAAVVASSANSLNFTIGTSAVFSNTIVAINGKYLRYVFSSPTSCNLKNYSSITIAALPPIYPTSVASASTISTICDDLILGGSASTSNIDTFPQLTYQWIFTAVAPNFAGSATHLASLSHTLTTPIYTVYRHLLVYGSTYSITLRTMNSNGNSNDATITASITPSDTTPCQCNSYSPSILLSYASSWEKIELALPSYIIETTNALDIINLPAYIDTSIELLSSSVKFSILSGQALLLSTVSSLNLMKIKDSLSYCPLGIISNVAIANDVDVPPACDFVFGSIANCNSLTYSITGSSGLTKFLAVTYYYSLASVSPNDISVSEITQALLSTNTIPRKYLGYGHTYTIEISAKNVINSLFTASHSILIDEPTSCSCAGMATPLLLYDSSCTHFKADFEFPIEISDTDATHYIHDSNVIGTFGYSLSVAEDILSIFIGDQSTYPSSTTLYTNALLDKRSHCVYSTSYTDAINGNCMPEINSAKYTNGWTKIELEFAFDIISTATSCTDILDISIVGTGCTFLLSNNNKLIFTIGATPTLISIIPTISTSQLTKSDSTAIGDISSISIDPDTNNIPVGHIGINSITNNCTNLEIDTTLSHSNMGAFKALTKQLSFTAPLSEDLTAINAMLSQNANINIIKRKHLRHMQTYTLSITITNSLHNSITATSTVLIQPTTPDVPCSCDDYSFSATFNYQSHCQYLQVLFDQNVNIYDSPVDPQEILSSTMTLSSNSASILCNYNSTVWSSVITSIHSTYDAFSNCPLSAPATTYPIAINDNTVPVSDFNLTVNASGDLIIRSMSASNLPHYPLVKCSWILTSMTPANSFSSSYIADINSQLASTSDAIISRNKLWVGFDYTFELTSTNVLNISSNSQHTITISSPIAACTENAIPTIKYTDSYSHLLIHYPSLIQLTGTDAADLMQFANYACGLITAIDSQTISVELMVNYTIHKVIDTLASINAIYSLLTQCGVDSAHGIVIDTTDIVLPTCMISIDTLPDNDISISFATSNSNLPKHTILNTSFQFSQAQTRDTLLVPYGSILPRVLLVYNEQYSIAGTCINIWNFSSNGLSIFTPGTPAGECKAYNDIISAVYTHSHKNLELTFIVQIIAVSTNPYDYLSSNILGTGATMTVGPNALNISLGSNPIYTLSIPELKTDSLYFPESKCLINKFTNVGVSIDGSGNSPALLVAIDGPYYCEGITLDASNSTSQTQNPTLTYAWKIVSITPNADIAEAQIISSISSTLDMTAAKLHIPDSLLLEGREYTANIRVTNSLNNTVSANVKFKITYIDKISLSVGISHIAFDSSQEIILRSDTSYKYCSPYNDTTYTKFAWSLKSPAINLPSLTSYPSYRNHLYIPRLPTGNYQFTITAYTHDDESYSSAKDIYVTIYRAPLRAIIQGGNRSINADTTLYANSSVDMENSNATLTYIWTCKYNDGTECQLTDDGIIYSTLPQLTLEYNSLVFKTELNIILTVHSNDTSAQTRSIIWNGKEGPMLRANSTFILVNHGIQIESDSDVTTWSATPLWCCDVVSRSRIAIIRLITDRYDTINVSASSTGGSTAYIPLKVYHLPAEGGCGITPLTGTALSTVFSITCSGWQNTQAQYLYQFSIFSNFSSIIAEYPYSFINSMRTILPMGTIYIRVMVKLNTTSERAIAISATTDFGNLVEYEMIVLASSIAKSLYSNTEKQLMYLAFCSHTLNHMLQDRKAKQLSITSGATKQCSQSCYFPGTCILNHTANQYYCSCPEYFTLAPNCFKENKEYTSQKETINSLIVAFSKVLSQNPQNETYIHTTLRGLGDLMDFHFMLNETVISGVLTTISSLSLPSTSGIIFEALAKICQSSEYIPNSAFKAFLPKIITLAQYIGSHIANATIERTALYSPALSLSITPLYFHYAYRYDLYDMIDAVDNHTYSIIDPQYASLVSYVLDTYQYEFRTTIITTLITLNGFLSPIVDISIAEGNSTSSLNISLPLNGDSSSDKYECAYLNLTSNSWLSDGCTTYSNYTTDQFISYINGGNTLLKSTVSAQNTTVYNCHCSHLTPFALVEKSYMTPLVKEAERIISIYHIVPTMVTIMFICFIIIAYMRKKPVFHNDYLIHTRKWMSVMFNKHYTSSMNNPQEPHVVKSILITPFSQSSKQQYTESKISESTLNPTLETRVYSIPDEAQSPSPTSIKRGKTKIHPFDEKSSSEDVLRTEISVKIKTSNKLAYFRNSLFVLVSAFPLVSCFLNKRRFIENRHRVIGVLVRVMSFLASSSIIYYFEHSSYAGYLIAMCAIIMARITENLINRFYFRWFEYRDMKQLDTRIIAEIEESMINKAIIGVTEHSQNMNKLEALIAYNSKVKEPDKQERALNIAGIVVSITLLLVYDIIGTLYIIYSHATLAYSWSMIVVGSVLADMIGIPLLLGVIVIIMHSVLHKVCPSRATYIVGLKIMKICNLHYE